jgi:hypothetical protein
VLEVLEVPQLELVEEEEVTHLLWGFCRKEEEVEIKGLVALVVEDKDRLVEVQVLQAKDSRVGMVPPQMLLLVQVVAVRLDQDLMVAKTQDQVEPIHFELAVMKQNLREQQEHKMGR